MRDNLLNFAEKKVEPEYPSTTTTLIIEKVPSEVAYEILTNCLMRGDDFSRENLQQKIQERIVGDGISVSYKEIYKDRLFSPSVSQCHTYGPVQVDDEGKLYRQCECGHRINVPLEEASIGPQIPNNDHNDIGPEQDDSDFGFDDVTPTMPDGVEDDFGYGGGSDDITPHRL